MGYWIHDREVLDILEKNHIRYERDGRWSNFTVEYLFDHGKSVHLKGGSLVLFGACLYVGSDSRWNPHVRDEDLYNIPGRYIDTYPLDTEDAREALQRNGYTMTFVGSDTNHMYFEVNAYIPEGEISKLPDGTLLLYEESGSVILYHK